MIVILYIVMMILALLLLSCVSVSPQYDYYEVIALLLFNTNLDRFPASQNPKKVGFNFERL